MLLLLLLAISASLASARSPIQCTYSYAGYYVAAYNNDWDAGVLGWNQVRTVHTEQGSWQVRSVWVKEDDDNWVEVGWLSRPGYWPDPTYFAAWGINGSYSDWRWWPATPGTYHWFKVFNPTGGPDSYWEFWVDNTPLPPIVNTNFDVGLPGGQSEAHNTCDQAGTSWWALQKYIRTYGNWYYWTRLGQYQDNNPGYYLYVISNHEFKVYPNGYP